MLAVVQDAYGSVDVLSAREVDRPPVGADEVLVRVRATSVHPDVWHVVSGRPLVLRLMGAGLRRPKVRVPGTDLAGVVEQVGTSVARFQPGDEVYGESIRRHQWANGGAFAEYAAVPASALQRKPSGLSFEEAAAVPTSALIALQGVHDQGHVRDGQRVLVNGAGGGVGIFAVQLAKARGAQVTAVDTAPKLEVLRSLGADDVRDCAQDFTRSGEQWDVIVDIPGNRSFAELRRVLTPTGRYVLIGHDAFGRSRGKVLGSLPHFLALTLRSPFVSQRMAPRVSPKTVEPLGVITRLIEDGRLRPVVDRTFPLTQVAGAMRYLAEGGACGKVVLTV